MSNGGGSVDDVTIDGIVKLNGGGIVVVADVVITTGEPGVTEVLSDGMVTGAVFDPRTMSKGSDVTTEASKSNGDRVEDCVASCDFGVTGERHGLNGAGVVKESDDDFLTPQLLLLLESES